VSAPKARVVNNVRLPGWTPKFSQFIHDNLAVKSDYKIENYEHVGIKV